MSGKKKFLVLLLVVVSFTLFRTGSVSFCQEGARAKYVFLFIGDGMGISQRTAAELYLAWQQGRERPEAARLVMNTFPAHGLDTTYDLTNTIPDSASAGTAISCGSKTRSGVIAMDAEGKVPCETFAEASRKRNRKIGILTTVPLDDATPAVFYAHVPNRKQSYDIAVQLANSGFDYFAGGPFREPLDKKDPGQPDAVEIAKKNGYTIAPGRAALDALKPGAGKVIAISDVADRYSAMPFALDQGKEHVGLSEYLAKGIELLENPDGFFIMVEGGKIDWACHLHDAAAAVHETLALDAAVQVAVDFQKKHPEDTLIVVTADHETGGLSIGYAGTRFSSHIEKIGKQKMSGLEFTRKLEEFKKMHGAASARLEDLMPQITESFGLYVASIEVKAAMDAKIAAGKAEGATDEARKISRKAEQESKSDLALGNLELTLLREAFKQSMLDDQERAQDEAAYLLYGNREPLTITLTTILGNKAGLGWTTFAHTGMPVLTSALGVGAELFNGYYDQTEIHSKMMKASGFGK